MSTLEPAEAATISKTQTDTPSPIWRIVSPSTVTGPFFETWTLMAADPVSQNSISLSIHVLVSANGFRRVAEISAIIQKREIDAPSLRKIIKKTFPLSSLNIESGRQDELQLEECRFSRHHTSGIIKRIGETLDWDLHYKSKHLQAYHRTPEPFLNLSVSPEKSWTLANDLEVDGKININGETLHLKNGNGILTHSWGSRYSKNWTWSHCNHFVDKNGSQVPFVFEAFDFKAELGPVPLPSMASFFFKYEGKSYQFNSIWGMLRSRSHPSFRNWKFRVDKKDISFQGDINVEHRDLMSMRSEDTDGGIVYLTKSLIADTRLTVYRRGKLECALYGNHSTRFEQLSREKNPYLQQNSQ